jgi:hypothetical protein
MKLLKAKCKQNSNEIENKIIKNKFQMNLKTKFK